MHQSSKCNVGCKSYIVKILERCESVSNPCKTILEYNLISKISSNKNVLD